MTTPADSSTDQALGRVEWEIVEVATGQVVDRGRRAVRATEVEVMVRPSPPPPRLGPDLRQVAAGLFGWLVTRGRQRTTKRLRLAAGFRLVLPERPGPKLPRGLALVAEREGAPTFCWEWFELDDQGGTATKLQETGTLRLQWTRNRHGLQELTRVEFVTDVSLRLAPSGGDPRSLTWRVRVLAGSVIPWPESGNGLQLVPRLRPGVPPVRPG